MDKKKKEDDTFVFHSPFELNDNRLPGQIVQERLRVNWYGLHKFSPNMSITHFNRSTTNQSFMIRKGREVSRRRSSETPKVRSFYKTLTSRILTYEEINLGIEARIKEYGNLQPLVLGCEEMNRRLGSPSFCFDLCLGFLVLGI